MCEWLSLLETGVCFSNEETNETLPQKEEVKQHDWSGVNLSEAFQMQLEPVREKTPAQIAEEKMFGHKEGFLPKKRNLYEALESESGLHRFG